MPPEHSDPCPLCDQREHTHWFTSNTRKLKRDYLLCPNCALVWVPRAQHMSAEAEKARYDLHQNDPADDGYRTYLERLASPLIATLPPGARGLDFGAGPSPVLQSMLVEAGFPTEIYDPFYAPNAAVLEERFDFIVTTEVVEHLRAPRRELDQLWDQLDPNGVLAVMTQLRSPKRDFARWHYKNDPTHITFFSKETLRFIATGWGAQLELVDEHVAFFRR